VAEDELYIFIQQSIGSVWTLELLLLLRGHELHDWQQAELVRELRSSDTIVHDGLKRLSRLGLIVENREGQRYQPATPVLRRLVDDVAKLYAAKPVSVVRAITSVPDERLRIFSDAFRLKE